jgi:hypothetical protein
MPEMIPPPPPTRRSSSAPDLTLDKPDVMPPDPRRYLLFCHDENRCMLKALLHLNDVCHDRPQVWGALGKAHEAISGDMLHAQEKSFQRGVTHGKWLLKAQFDDAASLQMRVKHLEYVVGHYERWVRQLKTQLGEREPFSSNSNFPLDP